MRLMQEPIEVDVRVSTGGEIRPLAFTWGGRRYPVTGLGRSSVKADKHYFLVMTAGERIFELCWHSADNRWFLTRAPQERVVV